MEETFVAICTRGGKPLEAVKMLFICLYVYYLYVYLYLHVIIPFMTKYLKGIQEEIYFP